MINIAIDGPSGAGKSTLAKALARALNIYYLDTGSMYRAAAYAALQNGVDITDQAQVDAFIDQLDIHTVYNNGEQQNIVSGVDVMPYIRTPEVSKAASNISAYPSVRYKLVDMQRETANKYDLVLDGRDIGTFVLPDTKYKYFVTADVAERAKRRHKELVEKGINQSFDEVIEDMKQRDKNDETRTLAPLKKADDAVLVDTTNLSIDETVALIMLRFGQE